MSVSVNSILSLVNQYLSDATNNSVSANDRLQAVTESVKSVYNDFGFNQTNKTYNFNFYDTIFIYDITTALPDFLEPVDLYRQSPDQLNIFTRKIPRDLRVDLDNFRNTRSLLEDSFGIEQADGRRYLLVNHYPKNAARTVASLDSLGTWTSSSVYSEAVNVRVDGVDPAPGETNSIAFDLDEAIAISNGQIYNPNIGIFDLTAYRNNSAFTFWVNIPQNVILSGRLEEIELILSSDIGATPGTVTNYLDFSATTDYMGNPFKAGWNKILMPWVDNSPVVGSPDFTKIIFVIVQIPFSGFGIDDSTFKITNIKAVIPEPLTFLYQSWSVGTNTAGTTIYTFGTTTDVPFFSGQYDFFDTYCGHFAASILFDEMGLPIDASKERDKATLEKNRLKNKFPSQRLTQTKSLGVKSLNFRKRKI